MVNFISKLFFSRDIILKYEITAESWMGNKYDDDRVEENQKLKNGVCNINIKNDERGKTVMQAQKLKKLLSSLRAFFTNSKKY